MNKVQKQNAMRFYLQWQEGGCESQTTENNVFIITEGLVGKQGSTKPIRLIDAAVKYSVLKFPAKKRKMDLTSV